MSDGAEQSDIPIVVKHAVIDNSSKEPSRNNIAIENKQQPVMVNKEPPRDNTAILHKPRPKEKVMVNKEPPRDNIAIPRPKEKVSVTSYDDAGTYLRLSGSEEECVFSSKIPETKPTINVS